MESKTQQTKTLRWLEIVTITWAAIAALLALLFSALTYGLGAAWHLAFRENKFLPSGANYFRDMALRFLVIAAFFLIVVLILRVVKLNFVRKLALASLILALHQSRVLISTSSSELPGWVSDYSSTLRLLPYAGFYFLASATAILILEIVLIILRLRASNNSATSIRTKLLE